ncbi:MAG: histidinol-phosphate transaminase [Xanthomonadales bacterium]|nr:histidinol-phosphate transaminase [Xanthomonadales bacterium]
MNIEALARPEVLALKPYVSARGSAAADGVLLNANEAPHSLAPGLPWQDLALHRYPPPQPADLRERLAGLYGVEEDSLLVTRGSDEGIDLLLRVFCRAGKDAILETIPCFGMYRVAAAIQGARVIQVERDADTLEVRGDALLEAIERTDNLKLVFLTSPGNPTGDTVSGELLERVLEATKDRALVVMDEAYIEFCEAPSAVTQMARHPHLVVLRTLSKAWGAAGLRCGAVLANPAVIGLLGRVMAPYPLTAPAIAAALAVTGRETREQQKILLLSLAREKGRLVRELTGRPWVRDLWPGEANFVLIRVNDGPALVRHCAEQGVRVRDFHGQPLLDNCVRMTVGSPDDMGALRAALDTFGA